MLLSRWSHSCDSQAECILPTPYLFLKLFSLQID